MDRGHNRNNHEHRHGPGCGHPAIRHEKHVDYLDGGRLCHQLPDGQIEEHVLGVDTVHPAACTPNHHCGGHEPGHVHGPNCGHPAIPHGDHIDYLVDGHLHHPHGDHCDFHGTIRRP